MQCLTMNPDIGSTNNSILTGDPLPRPSFYFLYEVLYCMYAHVNMRVRASVSERVGVLSF